VDTGVLIRGDATDGRDPARLLFPPDVKKIAKVGRISKQIIFAPRPVGSGKAAVKGRQVE